jgi:protein SCO1/2
MKRGCALTLLCAALLACGESRAVVPAAAAPLPAESLYRLDDAWQDERGETLRLDLWRGHPTAVVLFFGTCEEACPAIVHELQRIEAELPASTRAELRALLVTIDPERDTSAALLTYARESELPLDRWRLLRGDGVAVRTLAAALGVRYRRLPSGQFSHSLQITFLDRDGVIAGRVERLGEPVEAVARLLAP